METTRALMPRARQDELVVEELPDETLVYDLKRHKAHCLNRTSALVWQHCDGRTTVAEVAALLERQLKIPADEAVVWMALDRLGRAHLLREQVTLPAERARYSRREVLRTLRRAAGISLLLPVIESIVAPRAAAQASCVTASVCLAAATPSCLGGMPICSQPGQCCRAQGQSCVVKKC
ncbi:MAG: PqqD family protein [Gemmatimonadetes bacterium]|nr:PqqD family protein [Gemmatimonadota bacterium]